MLLEFKTSNYKSFKEELIFSLIPAPKQKGLDYSVLKQDINKKDVYKRQLLDMDCFLHAKSDSMIIFP